ncbi:arylsulfatase [Bradyrhizobium sp. CCGUVB1N3]|uniref:arylsulfatase n=1 Tax=Bradyrhizobium sp. CCGUVB1N3 TaxID=2949629 RepID=UPI0020B1D70B|nr:arylsulfatase [Bradyrhizobium sp. CCGUVB1N3]MCP3469999.1 arylsulfatase [Bradyrhizobium sp. CCGUVB1N3]
MRETDKKGALSSADKIQINRRRLLGSTSILAASALASTALPRVANAATDTVLPRPEPPFAGKIERTVKGSTPDFPKGVEAPAGAPNVLLILTDDVGFGATSVFGGPIQTPNFQRVADNGLRYNMYHTTALCSPTRAALITGRNHHSVASGVITEFATGFPGYNSLVPKSAGSVGAVLRENGYNTSWFGKMHNVPDWMSSQAGPFDLWPNGLGFEHFYGFIGGDSDQWHPALYENMTPIEPYLGNPNYILDIDLADKAIAWMRMQHALAPTKPWLVYYATGTAHAPHHAPKDWIAKYKGQFDRGWDKVREETLARQIKLGVVPANTKLTARPEQLPAWDSLSADQKRLYARMMEVYAGALSHADYNIGRLLDAVEQSGQMDNTLVIFMMGDNGASAEGSLQGTTNEVATAGNGVTESLPFLLSMIDELGGPLTYNHYPVGWAHAMDTPMQWTKQIASHLGGTRNGMVISWPARIKDKGGLRSQFCHVIDIVPTIYEAAKITPPDMLDGVKQKPIDGVSFVYTFEAAGAQPQHTAQYFEMLGNRAIYKDGWMASTTPLRLPWVTLGAEPNPDDFKWELYNIAEDFSQSNNLAAKSPEKLKELQDAFDVEARKYNVYPLDSSFASRVDPAIRPSLTRGRNEFIYYPGMVRIPEGSAPDFKNKSWTIAAEVAIPQGGANGVLATIGGRFGGWALLLMDGKPVFAYALSNQPDHKFRVASDQRLPAGNHVVRIKFEYEGGGIGKGANATLLVDEKQVAQGHIPQTLPCRFSLDETFDVGQDTGTPVLEEYADKMPFPFTGTLKQFVVVLEPQKLSEDERRRLQEALAKAMAAVN